MRAEKPYKRGSWYYRLPFGRKMGLWGVIFLLPWLIGFFLFFLKPMLQVFAFSFEDVSIIPTGGLSREGVGLANYIQALTVDVTFNKLLVSTLIEAVLYTPLVIIFSLLCAILLNGKFFGRSVARAIFFIPIIMATGLMLERAGNVTAMMAAEAQEERVYGAAIVSELLFSLGVGEQVITYLTDAVSNIFEIVSLSGIQILIFLAALQGISPSLYEVAHIEGATAYEMFWKVTVVMVSPMILTCTIYTLSDLFMRSDIMDKLYTTAFRFSEYGLSAAMSVVYMLVNLMVIGIAGYFVSKVVFYYD